MSIHTGPFGLRPVSTRNYEAGESSATLAAQTAISARRAAPSFARMCSMCADTVFGDTVNSTAI